MGVLRRVPEFRVKYKDVFHLKNLYVMMHEYLMEEGWAGPSGGVAGPNAHMDIESLYLEKFNQKGLHSGGKELWIYWRAKKKYEGKYSGYFRFGLDIDFHGVYIRDQEVMHAGKKMKINWGELEIFFRPYLETDYKEQKWSEHWFLKHIKPLYENRIMDQEFEKREKELWREAYRLQGKVKKFLNLRTFIPVPEPFHPAIYGYEP